MSPMGEDDGKDLAIAPEDRWQYVRLDNAKANMAPRGNKATWLKLEQVKLGNGTQDYPNGDTVAAMVAWDPPKVTDTLSVDQCNEVLDAIADGPGEGVRYTHSRRGKDASRWAGTVLVRLFGFTDLQYAKVIETWVRNGVLVRDTYRDPVQRKDRMCVRVVDAKRPGPVS